MDFCISTFDSPKDVKGEFFKRSPGFVVPPEKIILGIAMLPDQPKFGNWISRALRKKTKEEKENDIFVRDGY